MEIIPGLPDEIGRQCLLRVPWTFHNKLTRICKSWKNIVTSPLFYKNRKTFGRSQELIILSVRVEDGFTINIYDPLQNSYETLPPIPLEFPYYSYFSHCVSVNQKLVVMGFSNREELPSEKILFIYDFCSGRWKRGPDLPDSRFNYGCSVDSTRGLIYIAGGCDNDEQILFTAAVYSIEEEKWQYLPPMIWSDYVCHSAFADSKLYVVNRCNNEASVQCYDPNTRLWSSFRRVNELGFRVGFTHPPLAAFGGLFYVFDWNVIRFDYVKNQFHLIGTHRPQLFTVEGMAMWHSQIVMCGRVEEGDTVFYLFEPSRGGEHGEAGKEEKWTLLNTLSLTEFGDCNNCYGTLTL